MADLRDDDLFLVNRNDESATVQQSELMAELREDDYMIVNREDVTYKITGADLIDSVIDPLTLTPVVTPANPEIGNLLTVDPNVAGGKSPYSYTYQWKYRTSIVDPIEDYAGETASTYQTVSSDEGLFIACEVTVTDSRGTAATALSAFTAAVIKPPSIVKPSIIAPADNAGELVTAESDEIIAVGSSNIGSQVGIYASSNLDTAPAFGSYLDKGDTTTSWNTTWDSVTYTQTGGTGGTIGFWYSDDAVTWTRDSSTVWGTSPLGSGGTGVDAKRYMAFNADVTGAADGADVGYVDIPDMTGLTVILTQGLTKLTLAGDKDLTVFQPLDDVQQDSGYTPQTSEITGKSQGPITTIPSTGGTFYENSGYTMADLINTAPGEAITGDYYFYSNTSVVLNYANAQPGQVIDFYFHMDGPEAVTTRITTSGEISDGGVAAENVSPPTNSNVYPGLVTPTSKTGPDALAWLENENTSFKKRVRVTLNSTAGSIQFDPSTGYMYCFGRSLYGGSNVELTFADDTDLANFRVGDVESTGNKIIDIGPGNTMALGGGVWNNGDTVTGPDTTPATGTIASIDPATNTMTLSVSDETYPKRWINNAGKFVKGEETPSQDAAPEVSGVIDVTPETDEITKYAQSFTQAATAVGINGEGYYDTWENVLALLFDGLDTTQANIKAVSAGAPYGLSMDISETKLTGNRLVIEQNSTNMDSAGANVAIDGVNKGKISGGAKTNYFNISVDGVKNVRIVTDYNAANSGAYFSLYRIGIEENAGDSYDDIQWIINTNQTSYPELTLAGSKDLDLINLGDEIRQDSGHTPQTSAITDIEPYSVSNVKAYYSSLRPNNLAEALQGTEFDLTKANVNTVENSHYLTLVCEDGCPTSGPVFKADGGAIFDMKYSSGGGNFDENGNQLDAANNPPSGPSDTTEILFSDGGTTGYIVNIQAAYTILSTMNLGTVPVVSDAALGEEVTLTLTDDTDLANFRVGDVIGGFSDEAAVGSSPNGSIIYRNGPGFSDSNPLTVNDFQNYGGIEVAQQSASGNYGTKQYELTLDSALDTTGDAEFFAECWFYKETAAGNYAFNGNVCPFNFHGSSGLANTVLGGYISTTSHFIFYKGTGTTLHQRPATSTGTAFSDIGVGWHHLAWYVDNQGTNIYLNGVRVGGETLSGTATPDPTTRPTTGWSNTYQSNAGYCPNMPIACLRFSQGNPYGTAAGSNFTPLAIGSDQWETSSKVKLFIPMTGGSKVEVIEIKDDATPYQITFNGGTWAIGQTVTGPTTTPATGVVRTIDGVNNIITLSSSDESGTKRWISNAGKTVLGPTIQVPSNLKLYSSDFLSDPEGTLAHTQSDWQITLKEDTSYSSPISQSLNDSVDLTVWEPSNLEEGTAYRCRVRHKSNNVVSEWSDDSTFKTAEDDDENSLVSAPGDIWADAEGYSSAGAGQFRPNSLKFVSVSWGDVALGMGVDGNIYRDNGTYPTYSNMSVHHVPTEAAYTAFAQTYGSLCVAMREDGKLDFFNRDSQAKYGVGMTLGDNGVLYKGYSAFKNGTMMYFLGEDGKLYKANSETIPTALPEFFASLDVIKFAMGGYENQGYVIDSDQNLWVLDITNAGQSNAVVNTYTKVFDGTTFKTVVGSYQGSAVAVTTDNQLKFVNIEGTDNYTTDLETLPDGFELAEVGFGYYNIVARSKDGRIIIAGGGGAAVYPNGPFKPGMNTYDESTWAEYDLPRPCAGLGLIKECGVGYTFAFILP